MYVQSARLTRSKRILEPNSLEGIGVVAGAVGVPVSAGACACGCGCGGKLAGAGIGVETEAWAEAGGRFVSMTADDEPGFRARLVVAVVSAPVDGVAGRDDELMRGRLAGRLSAPVPVEVEVGPRFFRAGADDGVEAGLGLGLLARVCGGFWTDR